MGADCILKQTVVMRCDAALFILDVRASTSAEVTCINSSEETIDGMIILDKFARCSFAGDDLLNRYVR